MSRIELILKAMLTGDVSELKPPKSRIEALLIQILEGGGGGGDPTIPGRVTQLEESVSELSEDVVHNVASQPLKQGELTFDTPSGDISNGVHYRQYAIANDAAMGSVFGIDAMTNNVKDSSITMQAKHNGLSQMDFHNNTGEHLYLTLASGNNHAMSIRGDLSDNSANFSSLMQKSGNTTLVQSVVATGDNLAKIDARSNGDVIVRAKNAAKTVDMGVTAGGFAYISGLDEPTQNSHAANKKYVDDAIAEALTSIGVIEGGSY